METEERRKEKIEAISSMMINICIENGLTVCEMADLAIFFPKFIREKIMDFEARTAFTLNSD